jgi:hypothetical protein
MELTKNQENSIKKVSIWINKKIEWFQIVLHKYTFEN